MPEENYKSCLNCNKDDNRTGKPCPARKGCHFPNYNNWEAIVEKPEKQSADLESKFTLDQWKISWANVDYVEIHGPHNQKCLICGGDFESMLSALCGAFNEGRG